MYYSIGKCNIYMILRPQQGLFILPTSCFGSTLVVFYLLFTVYSAKEELNKTYLGLGVGTAPRLLRGLTRAGFWRGRVLTVL